MQGKVPKTLIVNVKDLDEYEEYLTKLYPNGIIPVLRDGLLRYKNIPLAISDQIKQGECLIEL